MSDRRRSQGITTHREMLVNGRSSGQSNANLPAPTGQPRQPRLLTVDEALQFSPFSSIVPFSSGISYAMTY